MINRAQLRGKPLDDDCRKAVYVKYANGHEDDRELCLGLEIGNIEFRVLPKCRTCNAYVLNAKFTKKGDRI